ncbi:glycosyl hydrolase family 28-related protein [Algiphilus sp. W345]|uniref:Glycosyl hydrolase family 28-related protein n=1 Tax=Banduia mediterranea TaxID=3075609 RepID=A0ABU2WER9_9GAMM|nr:glycosyl hydrolase family 28-related protein [Algiphilus sp. W345]MDT0496370.1 glycosyl hydrolase family 28-related protein [Algiphilus sp. W345]
MNDDGLTPQLSPTAGIGDVAVRRAALSVKMAPFYARGDGIADDRAAVDAALERASAIRGKLYFPPGEYVIRANGPGAVLRGRSNVQVEFAQGAVLKLENPARYPLTCFFEHSFVENATYKGLTLNGGGEVGPNGFGANNSKGIQCDGAHIYGFRRDPRTGGGRGITFQFNCKNIEVNSPKITNCTTGIDFHGRHSARLDGIIVVNPTISECEEAISFYDLFDGDINLNSAESAQVIVNGGTAFNCGKSTSALAPGTNGEGGGVVVSERGHSFSVRNFSVVNEPSYGEIGAVIRGSFSNSDVDVSYRGECMALVMFSPALNLAPVKPSAAAVSSGNKISIICAGMCDYVVYSDNMRGANLAFQNRITVSCHVPRISLMNDIAGRSAENFLEVISLENSKAVRGYWAELYEKNSTFPDASWDPAH